MKEEKEETKMEKNIENKEEKKEEINKEETKVEKKTTKKEEIKPKEVAVVRGYSLRISPKDSKFICKAISRKRIPDAINLLENVIKKKAVIEMRGAEIPHRKGKGIMSGRYPLNASKEILMLLKQLKANSEVNRIDDPIIKLAIANIASEPQKREGRRGKRTHIYIEAVDRPKLRRKKK